ncbi:MAG: helix-turn-helix domain-containing protein [Candidatus Bathyarchaeia archaeon]
MRGHKWRGNYIHKAQVEAPRMRKIENRMCVWMLVGERGNLTFSQLKKATGLCRQSLAKILRELEKSGLIYKDTVKAWEQFEHWKIIRSPLDAFMQVLMNSSTNELPITKNAVEAWLLRLVSVKPQHVGDIVYRMVKT